MDAGGAAVQGVMDEQITLHAEHTAAHRAGEHLHTGTEKRVIPREQERSKTVM